MAEVIVRMAFLPFCIHLLLFLFLFRLLSIQLWSPFPTFFRTISFERTEVTRCYRLELMVMASRVASRLATNLRNTRTVTGLVRSQPGRCFSSSALRFEEKIPKPPPPIEDSTSALTYKYTHSRPAPLPLTDLPRSRTAEEAVTNILYNTPPPSLQPFKKYVHVFLSG